MDWQPDIMAMFLREANGLTRRRFRFLGSGDEKALAAENELNTRDHELEQSARQVSRTLAED